MKYILILLLILGLIACDGNITDRIPTNTNNAEDYKKGTKGVEINFLKNAPGGEVIEGATFPIVLELKNFGSSEAEGLVALQVDKDFSEIKDIKQGGNEEGITNMRIGDNSNSVFFDYELGDNRPENQGTNINSVYIEAKANVDTDQKTDITVNNCYKYQTYATPTVCIDANYYDIKKMDKACEMKDMSLNSQGAPLAVTKIEIIPEKTDNGIKPRFKITINNRGKGIVLKDENYRSGCVVEETADETVIDWIKVEAALSFEENKLECEGLDNGYILLEDEEKSIVCFDDQEYDAGKGAFSAPLLIKIDYGYYESFKKEIEIISLD